MDFIQTYAKEILALFVPFVTWFLTWISKAKAKLIIAYPSGFTFQVQPPPPNAEEQPVSQLVYTKRVLVQNLGKEPATNVEVVLNYAPHVLNVWPPREYAERTLTDKRIALVFSSLAPSEWVDIQILSFNIEIPSVITARCEQCVAETIEVFSQQVVAPWKRQIAVGLIFAGMGVVVYLLVLLLQFLITQTPMLQLTSE